MMTKKTFLLIWFSLVATVVVRAQERQDTIRLTLEECLAYALGNNYTRQSVRLDEDIQESSWDQARLSRLPEVSAGLSEGVSDSRINGTNWNGSYDVSANVTLFHGGQINNEIRQSKLTYEQTHLRTQQYDNDLTVQVLQSFLAALGNEELLKYQESILETSEKQMNEGKVRFSAGQIIESDYLLLEAQYASDLNNITGTRISLDNSLVALKNLMSMELNAPVALIYPDDSALESMQTMPTRREVVARGMEAMPDIRISDYNVEIAETGLKISRSSLYPTLSMSGGVGTGHAQTFNNFGSQLSDRFTPQAGISLSIPIFNGNAARTRVRQSEIGLQQAELDRKQSVKDIQQMLINEYGNILSSASTYRSNDIRRHAQLSSFEAYTAMFHAGAITTVELLQQQNNYISAMNDYVQSKYRFMLQRKVLDVYMGEPIKM